MGYEPKGHHWHLQHRYAVRLILSALLFCNRNLFVLLDIRNGGHRAGALAGPYARYLGADDYTLYNQYRFTDVEGHLWD
jgi:hypothetical protein